MRKLSIVLAVYALLGIIAFVNLEHTSENAELSDWVVRKLPIGNSLLTYNLK